MSSVTTFHAKALRQTRLFLAALFVACAFSLSFMPGRASAALEPSGGGNATTQTPVQSATPGTPCNLPNKAFLGLPTWYKYLKGVSTQYGCSPVLNKLSQIWLIGLAALEIMLRLAAVLAVVFVLYGGIKLMTSQGEPGDTKEARDTITNALIGLVVAVSASAVISFIAGRFT